MAIYFTLGTRVCLIILLQKVGARSCGQQYIVLILINRTNKHRYTVEIDAFANEAYTYLIYIGKQL